MDRRQHISIDPNVCHGQACVSGTRILVSVVLYPRLTRESVQACIAYAADLTREEIVGLPA